MESRKRFTSFSTNLDFYYESHHINPKCMNGSNDQENLVLLTAREHYIAHWLLTKIYPDHCGINLAFFMMYPMKDKRRLTAKQFERIRHIIKIKRSKETKRKMSKSRTGHFVSSETKKKISKANTGKKHSEETKKKISNTKTGKTITPRSKEALENMKKLRELKGPRKLSSEHIQKLKNAIRPPHTEETKRKMSESIKESWRIRKAN